MEKEKYLNYLNELSDYKIASGYPDVQGWEVKDFDNRVIGKVDNLLVNKETKKVVYLDVEVDDTIIAAGHDPYGAPADTHLREFVNAEGENHIIIPIGLVDLHEEQNFVYAPNIDHRTFAETKRIQRGMPIARNYEVIILNSYFRPKRQENIHERDYISEYGDKVDWYDARNEGLKSRDRMEEDDFYNREEFNDSHFRRGKK